jgi:hypothetical protein
VFEQPEAEQRDHQGQADLVIRRFGGAKLLNDRRHDQRCGSHRNREQEIDRPAPEKRLQVLEVLGQELFAEIGYAQK